MSDIKLIYPYIRRLKRKKENLRAYVSEYKDTLKKELEGTGLFTEVNDTNPDGVDLVVFGFKNLERSTLSSNDFWEKMSVSGWVVFIDGDENWGIIQEFRKSKKITSSLTRMEGVIFFQKESYEDRKANPTKTVLDELTAKVTADETPIYDVPDWTSSHMKEEYIQRYANGDVFVETGTYLGQTVELVRRSSMNWQKIFSIELNDRLFKNAKGYFSEDARINILHGDSVDRMQDICKELNGAATFWLDAHASGPLKGGKTGPNPLVEELKAIKETGRTDHTIFIDDRRLFGSLEWGGLKEEQVMELLRDINPDYKIIYLDGETKEDIICATVTEREWANPEESNELPEHIKKYFNINEINKETNKPNKPKLIFMD